MAAINSSNNGGLIFPPILTIADTASSIRCSRRYVEYKIASGELSAIRLGPKCIRIRGRDLEAFLQKHSTV